MRYYIREFLRSIVRYLRLHYLFAHEKSITVLIFGTYAPVMLIGMLRGTSADMIWGYTLFAVDYLFAHEKSITYASRGGQSI